MSMPLDDYEAVRVLGKGAFGQAILMRHIPSQRLVVVKRQSGRAKSQAVVETRVMRGLVHPHIVRFIDAFQDERHINIVMDYCNGGDLHHQIVAQQQKKTHFPELTVRLWFAQCVSALFYCHMQHILHRDLKCENVLLHDGNVRVADFGLSRNLSSTSDFATTQLGTPHCLAPELCDGAPYNNRVDMWSLGVLLYELLTLRKPFHGTTLQDLQRCIVNEDPLPVHPGVYSEELTRTCFALLSKNPILRPSAAELLEKTWVKELLRSSLVVDAADLKLREASGWKRLMVYAQLEHSTVLQVNLPNAVVNKRQSASCSSAKLGVLANGEYTEEVGRHTDESGTLWIHLTDGFCVGTVPGTQRPVFREIAGWRIIRPSKSKCCDVQVVDPFQQQAEPPLDILDEIDLSCTARENHDRLYGFLTKHVDATVVDQLLESYDATETGDDDTLWTAYACSVLRPLQLVWCVQVLRRLVRLGLPQRQHG